MRRLATPPPAPRTPWLALAALACVLAAGCRTRPAQSLSVAAPASAPSGPTAGGTLAADVELLKSPDFVARSRAAERLVTAGERALPALGAVGEGSVHVFGTQQVGTTAPVLRAILLDLDEARLVHVLDSPWPVVRRETAGELGRRGRWSAVPHLLPRMDDEDPQVRAAAVSSLRRLTNRFFGFDANAPLQARRRAADRWREWWSVEGRVRAARDAGDGAG